MVQAVSSVEALPRRIITRSKTEPEQWRWRTDFIGEVKYGEIVPRPQVFLVEMRPGETILPHYHAVDQFQIFVAGSGSLVRNKAANPVTVHYVDHHTGYGPVSAGAQGLSYFALRPKTDSGPIYLHEPGYREKMKPGKKRHFNEQITLSTEPVLLSRDGVALEPLTKETHEDGLGAWMMRLGPDMRTAGPNPQTSGGQFYLVLNGSLEHEAESYPAWSVLYVEPSDLALAVQAGPKGLEVLVLQCARNEAA